MKMLTRREHSLHELKEKLDLHTENSASVDAVLEELVIQGIQSDRRFVEMLCRARFNAGKGPIKIEYELSQHRIAPDIIRHEMGLYEDKWATSAKAVKEKKFGRAAARSYQEWARQARFLQQRGFGQEFIDKFVSDE